MRVCMNIFLAAAGTRIWNQVSCTDLSDVRDVDTEWDERVDVHTVWPYAA